MKRALAYLVYAFVGFVFVTFFAMLIAFPAYGNQHDLAYGYFALGLIVLVAIVIAVVTAAIACVCLVFLGLFEWAHSVLTGNERTLRQVYISYARDGAKAVRDARH